jgi:hypothetical protein
VPPKQVLDGGLAWNFHVPRRPLYGLWFDLAEISEYLTLFRAPHGDTADTAEAWENLWHCPRPAGRWPALRNPGHAAREPEATT